MMVWVECYPDRTLVRILGLEGRHPKMGGKGRVIWRVSSRGGVGLVDLDYEETMPRCRENPHLSRPEYGIRVFRCREGWIVALERNLEEFLIASARESGIDMSSYGLSNDVRELHSQISRRSQPQKFVEFLRDLSSMSRRVIALAELLKELEHRG